MNNLDQILGQLATAQAEEAARATEARNADLLRQEAATRVLDLAVELVRIRGGDQPFIYRGSLHLFNGGRVTVVDATAITLPEGPQS